MLLIENLTTSYNEAEILKNINMKVSDGEIIALIGRNGVGKTTLLKTIMGLLNSRNGKIIFNDRDITNLSPNERARLGIGYVPQGREIFPYLTVFENLTVGLRSYGKTVMDEVLSFFPVLKSIMNRQGGNLSGGQQQQLAIARVLLREPRLILMDEPTEGIQPSVVFEIQEAIKKINKEKKVSILLVEQYLDFAITVADYIYVIDVGRIVFEGKIRELDEKVIKNYLTI